MHTEFVGNMLHFLHHSVLLELYSNKFQLSMHFLDSSYHPLLLSSHFSQPGHLRGWRMKGILQLPLHFHVYFLTFPFHVEARPALSSSISMLCRCRLLLGLVFIYGFCCQHCLCMNAPMPYAFWVCFLFKGEIFLWGQCVAVF